MQSARQSSQHAAHAVGLLMSLLRLAFASNFPSRPVVLATVAELIRGLCITHVCVSVCNWSTDRAAPEPGRVCVACVQQHQPAHLQHLVRIQHAGNI